MKAIFPLIVAIALMGCSEGSPSAPQLSATDELKQKLEPQIIDAVRSRLKDGPSARFQRTRVLLMGDDSNELAGAILCGEVNSKNSYGGYTGFREFEATYYVENEEFALRIDGEGGVDFSQRFATECRTY